MTGFIDGTENPSLSEAPEVALVPDESPGAGGSVVLVQQWMHDAAAFEALPVQPPLLEEDLQAIRNASSESARDYLAQVHDNMFSNCGGRTKIIYLLEYEGNF